MVSSSDDGRMRNVLCGHATAFASYLIFGFNILACKLIAQSGLVPPICLFTFRAFGAVILFSMLSLFLPKERVERKDLLRIFIASMLGLFLTQITFLVAIKITTPFDVSVVASLTPIFTMFFASIYLKEPITWKKALGVALSFTGVLWLIFNSVNVSSGVETSSPLGIFLMVLNGLFFSIYLSISKPVINKYSVVTYMKWMFLFSLLVSLPFDLMDLATLDYGEFSTSLVLSILYVVIFATFLAYLSISFAQRLIRPTLVSLYSYVQPIVAACLGVYWGMDVMTWQKVCAALLVFVGVAVVNASRSKAS
ncbi:MAG: EamA family transporter [Paludibacteraceae bacterium]|nr:EamA family transporter [Paludibacteraceae bacterium]